MVSIIKVAMVSKVFSPTTSSTRSKGGAGATSMGCAGMPCLGGAGALCEYRDS